MRQKKIIMIALTFQLRFASNTNYLFYTNCLTSIVKRIRKDMQCLDDTKQGSTHRIELVPIHGLLKIAVVPLTASKNRYLCIYLDPRHQIKR